MGLSIVAAPSLADLTGPVAFRLGGPRDDPFAPEWVVVPSAGVREYLIEHIPRSGGACPVLANVRFIYPGRFNTLALGVEHPDDDPWSVEQLRWTVLQVLEEDAAGDRSVGAPRFAESQRRFAYASKIATLFERYGVQRPEMLVEWQRAGTTATGGKQAGAAAWQRTLWCRVRDRIGTESPAERIVARAALGSAAGSGRRFTLVGLDLFSPGKVAILEQLAATDDLAVFTIQPSASAGITNPLLRSWGRPAADAATLLRATGREIARVEPSSPTSLLGRIQRDIAGDRMPGSDGTVAPDPSVQIHLCHGPTRQVEVLRDAVLHAMVDDPTLTARDVLVVCTDVETFAPLVGPIFASLGLRAGVVDRASATRTPVDLALELVLDCVGGRCGVEPLLDLLSSEIVADGFGVTGEDLERIGRIVNHLDVRWGLGPDDRERAGLPAPHVGTWRHAVDRLLAGALAHAVGDGPLVHDVVPFDDLDGQSAVSAAKLAVVLRRLEDIARLVNEAERDGGPAAWAKVIDAITAAFLTALPGDPRGLTEVRVARADLVRAAEIAPSARLGRTEFRDLLLSTQGSEHSRSAEWRDVVRVGSINRMRGVPAKVIAVLGLDDGRLRVGGSDGDDLLPTDPRPGDRDPRAEERLALLNFVMAARDRLIVLADGHSVTTNERVAPSTALQELVETVSATIARPTEGGQPDDPFERNPCVTFHARQAFDPVNFGLGGSTMKNVGSAAATARPWSLDERALRILAAAPTSGEAAEFPTAPEPPSEPDEKIDLTDLIRSVRRPVAHYAHHTLLVALSDDEEPPDSEIELWPGGLTESQIGRELLTVLLAGRDIDTWVRGRALRGGTPPGLLAEPFWGVLRPAVTEIAECSGVLGVEPAVIPLHEAELAVTGSITVYGTAFVDAAYVRRHASARTQPWLTLAALTLAAPQTLWTARIVRRASSSADAKRSGSDVHVEEFAMTGDTSDARAESARRVLAFATDIRRRAEKAPIPFFDRTSWDLETGSQTTLKADLERDTGTPAARWVTGPLLVADLRSQPDTDLTDGLPAGDYPALRFAKALTGCWSSTTTVIGTAGR